MIWLNLLFAVACTAALTISLTERWVVASALNAAAVTFNTLVVILALAK